MVLGSYGPLSEWNTVAVADHGADGPTSTDDLPVEVPAEARSPAFMLMAVGRRLRGQIERELRARQLSLRHLSALAHLSRQPGLSYSELDDVRA